MKTLRRIAVGFGAIVAGLVCVAITARFSDGPIGPFPGGPLVEGRLIDHPVRDWTFVDAVRKIHLQLLNPPRSRTTWVLFHNGSAYIPCGLPNFRFWKRWPHQALVDGRALIRVKENRYRVTLSRVEDPTLQRELTEKLRTKYGVTGGYSGTIWFFAVGPPSTR